jgi:hypothetical protein
MPGDPNVIFPGFILALVTKSWIDLTGEEFGTTRRLPYVPINVAGAKSAIES